MKKIVVGMFGTCGGSTWRDPFIEIYRQKGIQFFNPQVDDWKPELAQEEARHLAEDPILLFPVTGETFGIGSLAESGFSVIQALKLDRHRDVVVMIQQQLNPGLAEQNPSLAKDSLRGRKLVLQHLKELRSDRIYLVETLEEMLQVSLVLCEAASLRSTISHFALGEK